MPIETEAETVRATLYRLADQIGHPKALVSVSEIAGAMDVPVATVKAVLAGLSSDGDVLPIDYGGNTVRLTLQGQMRVAADAPS